MSKKNNIDKTFDLALEFDRWIFSGHIKALDRIPYKHEIILTSVDDPELTKANRALVDRRGKFIEARKTKVGWRFKVLK